MISYCEVACSHFGYWALPEIRASSSYHAAVMVNVYYASLKPCVAIQQRLPIQINYFKMFFNSYFALLIIFNPSIWLTQFRFTFNSRNILRIKSLIRFVISILYIFLKKCVVSTLINSHWRLKAILFLLISIRHNYSRGLSV